MKHPFAWYNVAMIRVLIAIATIVWMGSMVLAAAPIPIGHFATMSGKEATFGQTTDRGARLALAEFNAAGGIDGRPIHLITYDDKGESREAGIAVTRLITQDKVVAVIGGVTSGLSLAGGAVCQQYQVPMVTPSATNVRVTIGRDMVFRVCFTDAQQGRAIARFCRENLGLRRVSVLFDQSQAYSTGLKADFVAPFAELGGELLSEEAFTGGDLDFSAQLTNIKSLRPDAIFIPAYYSDVGNIAIQARRLGIGPEVPMIGGDGWDSAELAKIGGEAIEGCYYSNHAAADQPGGRMKGFIERYKAAYSGATPDSGASLGYDAAMVLCDAMKRCHKATGALAGTDIARHMGETRDFPGVTGTITIDKDRNARKPIVMVRMVDGTPRWAADVQLPSD